MSASVAQTADRRVQPRDCSGAKEAKERFNRRGRHARQAQVLGMKESRKAWYEESRKEASHSQSAKRRPGLPPELDFLL
eukprot:scaffold234063_cov13-Tisochrysis_lutea.AAC.1